MKKKENPAYIQSFDQFLAMDKFSFSGESPSTNLAKEFHENKGNATQMSDSIKDKDIKEQERILKSIKNKLKKLDLNLDETSLWGQDVNVQVSGDLIEVQVHHLPIRYIKKDKIEDVVKFIEENI